MRVPVAIGPVPVDAAHAWLSAAQESVDVIRSSPDLEVPADVVEAFQRYVDEWRTAADGTAGDEFLWASEVDVEEVRRVGIHWARIVTITRTGQSSLDTASPEAAPFYDAIVAGIATALAAAEDDEPVAAGFSEVVPAFDERVEPPTSTDLVRVLLVDDNDDIRMLLHIAFDRGSGFDVIGEAANGAEAVEVASASCPDAVVLDIDMPVMSGADALPRLREVCPDAAVVVFSARDHDDDPRLAEATAFVSKTRPIADVVAAVRAAATSD